MCVFCYLQCAKCFLISYIYIQYIVYVPDIQPLHVQINLHIHLYMYVPVKLLNSVGTSDHSLLHKLEQHTSLHRLRLTLFPPDLTPSTYSLYEAVMTKKLFGTIMSYTLLKEFRKFIVAWE